MSYSFTRASSHRAIVDDAAVTTAPMTIIAWFKTSETGATSRTAAYIGSDNSADLHYFGIDMFTDDVFATTRAGGSQVTSQSNNYTTAAWQFAGHVEHSATERNAWLNTVEGSTNTTSTSPTIIERIAIGGRGFGSSGDNFFEGLIAEVAFFDYAVNDTDMTSLAGGASPMALTTPPVRYYRLLTDGDLTDIVGGTSTLTVTGATFNADHPTVDDPPSDAVGSGLLLLGVG